MKMLATTKMSVDITVYCLCPHLPEAVLVSVCSYNSSLPIYLIVCLASQDALEVMYDSDSVSD